MNIFWRWTELITSPLAHVHRINIHEHWTLHTKSCYHQEWIREITQDIHVHKVWLLHCARVVSQTCSLTRKTLCTGGWIRWLYSQSTTCNTYLSYTVCGSSSIPYWMAITSKLNIKGNTVMGGVISSSMPAVHVHDQQMNYRISKHICSLPGNCWWVKLERGRVNNAVCRVLSSGICICQHASLQVQGPQAKCTVCMCTTSLSSVDDWQRGIHIVSFKGPITTGETQGWCNEFTWMLAFCPPALGTYMYMYWEWTFPVKLASWVLICYWASYMY